MSDLSGYSDRQLLEDIRQAHVVGVAGLQDEVKAVRAEAAALGDAIRGLDTRLVSLETIEADRAAVRKAIWSDIRATFVRGIAGLIMLALVVGLLVIAGRELVTVAPQTYPAVTGAGS